MWAQKSMHFPWWGSDEYHQLLYDEKATLEYNWSWSTLVHFTEFECCSLFRVHPVTEYMSITYLCESWSAVPPLTSSCMATSGGNTQLPGSSCFTDQFIKLYFNNKSSKVTSFLGTEPCQHLVEDMVTSLTLWGRYNPSLVQPIAVKLGSVYATIRHEYFDVLTLRNKMRGSLIFSCTMWLYFNGIKTLFLHHACIRCISSAF